MDRFNLYTLANPKPFAADGTRQVGYDVDFDLSARGRVPLTLAIRTASDAGEPPAAGPDDRVFAPIAAQVAAWLDAR